MSRDISAAMKAHVEGGQLRGAISLLRLAYDSGTTTVNSSDRDIVFNGETYLGVGIQGSISAIEESAETKASGISTTLTGIPLDYIADALTEDYQGRDARLYLSFLDADYKVIDDPMLAFRGRIDTQDISLGKEANISVNIESRLIDWERPRVRRYTNEDQQERYPNDKGLEFVSQMVEKEINWPGG